MNHFLRVLSYDNIIEEPDQQDREEQEEHGNLDNLRWYAT